MEAASQRRTSESRSLSQSPSPARSARAAANQSHIRESVARRGWTYELEAYGQLLVNEAFATEAGRWLASRVPVSSDSAVLRTEGV